ncbi:hypothetical protein BDW59DRAFT_154558 [Aspergillus cavernicola]|uniref:FAD-binding PCMH-type domain-containing protein n=1 Tax=Aspergillus cavernicola TaxID=176166 RepID=A0ABR4HEN6_9EURO
MTALAACLLAAVGGNSSLVTYPSSVAGFNLNIPLDPAAVTYPTTADQVSSIVKCAVQHDKKVQAHGGGHSYGNHGYGGVDGELVVDVQNFQQFSVDSSTGIATVGAGYHLGDVTTLLYDAGELAFAHGSCPSVGVGGHATVGGVGPTSRLYGTALDHIESVQIVLANGSIITASESSHPDVFFAVQGAGAGFGIVTEFKFRTETPPTLGVQYQYTFAGTNITAHATALKEWQAFVAQDDIPRELSSMVIMLPTAVSISGTYFGSEADFDALDFPGAFTAPFTETITIYTDWLSMVDHWADQAATLETPSYFYAKALDVHADNLLTDDVIDSIFEYTSTTESGANSWYMSIQLAAGAINDIASDATAFPHRDVLYWFTSFASANGTVPESTFEFLDGINEVVETGMPGVDFSAYAGYVDYQLENAQQSYWKGNLPRLETIKALVDPQDVFHNPQSVRPSS